MDAAGGLSGWWVRCAAMTDHDPTTDIPRNTYFGEPWDAPITDDPAQQVPTPVGEPCTHCDMAVVEGEQGLMMLHIGLDADGKTYGRVRPVHRECHLRGVLGPVSHMEGRCDCRNPDADRSPAAWRREGQEVVERLRQRRG